jgi:hypothetical protein
MKGKLIMSLVVTETSVDVQVTFEEGLAYPAPAPGDFDKSRNFEVGHFGSAVGSAEAVFEGTIMTPVSTNDNRENRNFIHSF